MDNGDVALDKEIEELALDRPPCSILALGGSETTGEDIFKDVNKVKNDYEAIVSSRLATCLIDKPLSCQDETFDPLSSSEKNFDVESIVSYTVSSEYAPEASGNDIVEIHSPDHIIPETIHVVSSSTLLAPHLQVIPHKSLERKSTNKYTNIQHKLVSCLKGDGKSSTDKIRMRCVHFTEPGIVTEFIEPVNPWRDMRTPSKGEVVSFYKNVCQKMKCKPLDKVIKQIQDAPDLSTRSGTLVLRGCRLDNRSCEALESVFKRVQFENLDLENCNLEEDGATAILEMIEFYHSTCKLNIACNPKIGLRGWQALCRMLRKTPCLTYLDARRTILTEMTMPTFGRCLKADPYLKVLHLEGVFLSGRPLLILTTALKYNRLLEELYLGDNDLTSSDGPSLGAMLTYNTTLQLLDLRNNQIKDIGLAHIGNGLSDQSEQPYGGLCSLITWNNGLTHEGMSYLCEGLVKTTTLKALNLGQNRIGDLGVQKLKPGLIKNKSLRKLGFLNTKLGSEGAVALAEVLADSWSITRIDIRENNVQTAGLMAFAMALKVNQSLLRLDLDKDIRKEPGMETVMQSVLVDIYNLCCRNKQLIRRSMTPSLSTSTHSITTTISRQSSTSSEINEPFSCDDVFHPEAATQEITPYSPVVSIENPIDVNSEIIFSTINKVISTKHDTDTTPSTESLGNSISPVFESIKRGRTYSDPIRKNPDPALNERRASRFSVTKILDSLGNHAAGVANKIAQIDSKLKKQHSKEKTDIKSSELMPVLDQNQPIELDQFKSLSEQTNQNGGNNSSIFTSYSSTKEIIPEESNAANLCLGVTDDLLNEEVLHITGNRLCTKIKIMEDTASSKNEENVREISSDIQMIDVLSTERKYANEEKIDLRFDSTDISESVTGNVKVDKVNGNNLTNNGNIVVLVDKIVHTNNKTVLIDNPVGDKNIDIIYRMSEENDLIHVNNINVNPVIGIEVSIEQTNDDESSTYKIKDITEIKIIESLDEEQPTYEHFTSDNEINIHTHPGLSNTCESLTDNQFPTKFQNSCTSHKVDINKLLTDDESTIGISTSCNVNINTLLDEISNIHGYLNDSPTNKNFIPQKKSSESNSNFVSISDKSLSGTNLDVASSGHQWLNGNITNHVCEINLNINNEVSNNFATLQGNIVEKHECNKIYDEIGDSGPNISDLRTKLDDKHLDDKHENISNTDNLHNKKIDTSVSYECTDRVISGDEKCLVDNLTSACSIDISIPINHLEQFSIPGKCSDEAVDNLNEFDKLQIEMKNEDYLEFKESNPNDSDSSLKHLSCSNVINDDIYSSTDTIFTNDTTSTTGDVTSISNMTSTSKDISNTLNQCSGGYILDFNVIEGQTKAELLNSKLGISPMQTSSSRNQMTDSKSNDIGIDASSQAQF